MQSENAPQKTFPLNKANVLFRSKLQNYPNQDKQLGKTKSDI